MKREPSPRDIFGHRLYRMGAEKMRERAEAIVRKYLQFDSQRAVSWHEVQDCCDAIRSLPVEDTNG